MNNLSGAGSVLDGRRIYVLEDEALVSMMIEAMIEEIGGIVLAAHSHVEQALEFVAARHAEIDAAVIDLNLGGTRSYDVAAALTQLGVPFVFSTGYDDGSIPPEWRGKPLVRKPFRLEELADALTAALASAHSSKEEA